MPVRILACCTLGLLALTNAVWDRARYSYSATPVQKRKKGDTSTSRDERRVGCLFLVQPNEGNAFDQFHLEFELWGKHEVPVVRATLE